jgi:hypothetical protein
LKVWLSKQWRWKEQWVTIVPSKLSKHGTSLVLEKVSWDTFFNGYPSYLVWFN